METQSESAKQWDAKRLAEAIKLQLQLQEIDESSAIESLQHDIIIAIDEGARQWSGKDITNFKYDSINKEFRFTVMYSYRGEYLHWDDYVLPEAACINKEELHKYWVNYFIETTRKEKEAENIKKQEQAAKLLEQQKAEYERLKAIYG
jgi:hypothetical protein